MIRPIQYLRGIAALTVVWLHALTMMDGFTGVIGPPMFGASGVHVFFVISGFIMLMTTLGKETTAGEFIRHRIVRVVPLYWVATLLMVGCALVGAFKKLQFSPVTLIKSLLFVPYGQEPVLVPGWTLNYEMFFYALFALSLLLPKRARLPSLAVAMVGLVSTGYLLHPTGPVASAYTSPLLLEFLAGSVIAYLWINRNLRLPLPVSLGAIAIGTAVLFGWTHLFGCYELIGSALVVTGCLNERILQLKSSWLLALGDASYSIYLTHLFPLAAMRVLWLHFSPHASILTVSAFMGASLAVSAVFGLLVHHMVEKPLTRQLRQKRSATTTPRLAPRTIEG